MDHLPPTRLARVAKLVCPRTPAAPTTDYAFTWDGSEVEADAQAEKLVRVLKDVAQNSLRHWHPLEFLWEPQRKAGGGE